VNRERGEAVFACSSRLRLFNLTSALLSRLGEFGVVALEYALSSCGQCGEQILVADSEVSKDACDTITKLAEVSVFRNEKQRVSEAQHGYLPAFFPIAAHRDTC
jgi:hypothetical protein